jgi:hypothetical protein
MARIDPAQSTAPSPGGPGHEPDLVSRVAAPRATFAAGPGTTPGPTPAQGTMPATGRALVPLARPAATRAPAEIPANPY